MTPSDPASSNMGAACASEPPEPLAILNSIGEAVYEWDLLTDALRWSPNAGAVLQFDDMDQVSTGEGFHHCTAPVSLTSRRDAVLKDGQVDAGNGVPYQVRYCLEAPMNGRAESIWIDDTGRWFAGRDGRPAQAHGLIRVAAGRGDAAPAQQARDNADPLTGCLTRARLLHVLDAALGRASGKRGGFGLLLIGVEDLATLNRLHGYDAVDDLLAGLGTLLRDQIRGTDQLARYAGNKFALLLGHCDPEQIAPAAARALELLTARSIATCAGPLTVSVRIGGVLAPRHGRNVHTLLAHAEHALDGAKDGQRYVLFDPALVATDDARRVEDCAAEIVAALNEGRVRIATQPIVPTRAGEPAMAEALVRIVLADGAVLDPSAILPAAGRAQLLPLLDHRVFDLVVAHVRETGANVSMNLSAATLKDPGWPARVAATVRLNPFIAGKLIFEVSEGDAAADLATLEPALPKLVGLGVGVAVDHFGAGHASLRLLRQLKPAFVKIDGAFVQNIARSPDDRFLVRGLLAVARQVGVPAIAEWVEDACIATTLTEWGVRYMQGAYFGAPEMIPEVAPTQASAVA